jgi:acetyl-CoA acetyltransferase
VRPAYLCEEGLRTPIGRFGSALASVLPDDLLASVIRDLLARLPGLNPGAIDDVVMGCANQAGEDNRNVARMALLLAGMSDSVAGVTINRLCGSGLDAVGMAARAIVVVQEGEHPRQTSLEKLAKLATPFREGGCATAGNASGVNDNAAGADRSNRVAQHQQKSRPVQHVHWRRPGHCNDTGAEIGGI